MENKATVVQNKPTTRELGCCVCGEYAGRFQQHWNRDTGFGVCRSCIDWLLSRGTSAEEITSLYGVEGVNYASKVVAQ